MLKQLVLAVLVTCVPIQPCVAESTATSQTSQTRQTFDFGGVACTLASPAGFAMSTRDTRVGRMFIFMDPRAPKAELAVLSISIVPVGSQKPNQSEVMEGVLDAYREKLKGYSEKLRSPQSINAQMFDSKSFTGSHPNTAIPACGSVYITTYRNCYVIAIPEANGSVGAQSQPKMIKAIESIKLAPANPKAD